MNSNNVVEILSPNVLKLLQDKFYDKRKQAALEIEKSLRQLLASPNSQTHSQIQNILKILVHDFCYSPSSHIRNGGLIGMAACGIAMGPTILPDYLSYMIPPVLGCLLDQDARVRYYACEAMYNLCKVARRFIFFYFNEIFDALGKLAADPELSVKNGADLLDRLVKDIVSEHASPMAPATLPPPEEPPTFHQLGSHTPSLPATTTPLPASSTPVPSTAASTATTPATTTAEKHPLHSEYDSQQNPPPFSLPHFIPLLAERIYTVNPFTRSFLIGWIEVLDAVPHLQLITWIHYFLDGLLGMVSDQNEDVRVGAVYILGELLKQVEGVLKAEHEDLSPLIEEQGDKSWLIRKNNQRIPIARILSLLIPHTRPHIEQSTQRMALYWIRRMIAVMDELNRPLRYKELGPLIPEIVSAVLPCLAGKGVIRREAEGCDQVMRQLVEHLVQSKVEELDIGQMVNALTLQFLNEHEKTRVAALEWLLMLHQSFPQQLMHMESGTFPALLKTLSDASDRVVERDLQLLAQISKHALSLELDHPQPTNNAAASGNNTPLHRLIMTTRDIQQYAPTPHFSHFLQQLLSLFWSDRKLLEQRGGMVIDSLSQQLGGERVYFGMADCLEQFFNMTVLEEEGEVGAFMGYMVEYLNLTLLTASGLFELRKLLSSVQSGSFSSQSMQPEQALFIRLYLTWIHHPPSLLALLFLCRLYKHASYVLMAMTGTLPPSYLNHDYERMEIQVSLLIGFDKLIQILESPIFTDLRMRLVEGTAVGSEVRHCLWRLLMVLPQSSAFVTLRNRLSVVSGMHSDIGLGEDGLGEVGKWLIQQFISAGRSRSSAAGE